MLAKMLFQFCLENVNYKSCKYAKQLIFCVVFLKFKQLHAHSDSGPRWDPRETGILWIFVQDIFCKWKRLCKINQAYNV